MLLVEFTLWFLVFSLTSAAEGHAKVKSKPGADVTLHCQGPNNATITLLEWTKADLKPDEYVFLYRNSRSYDNYQHPSFKGRVEFKDKSSVKDGDVSVIVKNVNINDTGTYVCRIVSSITIRGERTTSELTDYINLTVTDSDDTAKNTVDGANEGGANKDEGNGDRKHEGEGNEDRKREDGNKTTIGVIVGVVVFVIVVAVGVLIYRNKHRDSKEKESYKHPDEKGEEPA
ncbi:myelin protein P0-like [Anabas testudineus]|uniref:myelin protein P0-like n=1 Tax=Anabas testudineus TaxID=64144 RepID=UPI000E460456|nr:myelin protein P0-like [Anabas testudineus]